MGIYKSFEFSRKNQDRFELDLAPDLEILPLQTPQRAIEFDADVVVPTESSSIAESFVTLYNACFDTNVSLKHESDNPSKFIEMDDLPLTDLDSNCLDKNVKAYINEKIVTVVSLEELYKEVFDTAMYLLQEIGIQVYILV